MPALPPRSPGSGDLRKLGHFVAVAEELHFTRAAARLHMAQQALSSSVSRLERDLGVELFRRSPRRVELTPAGRVLLDDAPNLLAAFDAAWRRAQIAGSTAPALPITVGRTPAITGDEVMSLLVPLRAANPEIAFRVTQCWPDDLPRLLRAGELGFAFARAMTGSGSGGIVSLPLRGHGQVFSVALHHDDSFASTSPVALQDLSGHQLVVWTTPERSAYTRLLLALCADAGFRPELRVSATVGAPPAAAVERPGEFAFVSDLPGRQRAAHVVALAPAPEAPVRVLHRMSPPLEISRIVETLHDGYRSVTAP